MISFNTSDRHGYSVKFSIFESDRLLLATSQLYGLAGGGTLYLLQLTNNQKDIIELCHFEWPDGLFDVTWCPYNPHVAATSSGDGSIQIWSGLDCDINSNDSDDIHNIVKNTVIPKKPVMCLKEHKNEIYTIDWNERWNNHQLLSGSWDGTLKLWDCHRDKSLNTFFGHTDLIYTTKFSPLLTNIFASVGCDGLLNLWNAFDFSGKPLMTIKAAYDCELLSLDWSQYDRNILVTGDSDGLIKAWDLRNMRCHTFETYSGEFAVRRLAFSPHDATILASANYDFTTRIWDFGISAEPIKIHEHHTEFVCGLDWSTHYSNLLADCGWDSVLNVFTAT